MDNTLVKMDNYSIKIKLSLNHSKLMLINKINLFRMTKNKTKMIKCRINRNNRKNKHQKWNKSKHLCNRKQFKKIKLKMMKKNSSESDLLSR